MSVSLRLSRGGSKKRPYYRIVAADIRSPRDGRYLERLGTYNPMKQKNDPERISLNIERIKYWLSVGAKPTDRVTKFLANEGLAKKPSIPKQTKQDKPKKKTLEKLKAKEEKLKSKQEVKNAVEETSVTKDEAAAQPADPQPSAPEEKKPEAAAQPADPQPSAPEEKKSEAAAQPADPQPSAPEEKKPEAAAQPADPQPSAPEEKKPEAAAQPADPQPSAPEEKKPEAAQHTTR